MLGRTISLYTNAYSGLSKSTWLLSLVMLVNRSGTMVIPFMTIYLTQPAMGYSIGQAGLVMGIFGLGAICGGFLAAFLLRYFLAICFFQIMTLLPVYYKKVMHLPEYMIGLVLALNGVLITLFEMVLVFKLEGKRENLLYIYYGVSLVAVSFALLNILPSTLVTAAICMVLAALGEILAMPFINSFWIARTTRVNRGQYAGLFTIAWSVAQALGPLAGSETAEHFDFRVLWWSTGGICFLSAIGFRRLRLNRLSGGKT